MACPACGRPVAVARASCMYCGAPLPEAAVRQAEAHTREVLAAPGLGTEIPAGGPERALVVLDLEGAEATVLAAALGLSAYEAGQRARAGGLHLQRVMAAGEAEAEAGRLRAAGVNVFVVPERELRDAAPVLVVGGERMPDDRVHLRAEEAETTLGRGDVLLAVKGPIARDVPPGEHIRMVRLAVPEPGYRIHLHRGSDPRPLELDPDDFDFGPQGPLAGSALLELTSWLEALVGPERVDDRFRRLPPALGPAAPDRRAVRDALASRAGGDKGPLRLDNVAQFRHYSLWRAAVERRRRGGVLPFARTE
jgi:hypothetical protein